MRLSYSSLNNLHNGHEWLNKQMGIPVPDYPFLKDGEMAHRAIQNHVSGKQRHPSLTHIEIKFPLVEPDMDSSNPRYWDLKEVTKFSFMLTPDYEIFGYIDGLDKKNKRFLEIKTSSVDWSMKKFRDAMQRKVYAMALPDFEEAYLITGRKDPDAWSDQPPKLYSLKLTEKDRNDAHAWIVKGIEILESGDFSGGLDKEGRCTGCFWNMSGYEHLANCHFI